MKPHFPLKLKPSSFLLSTQTSKWAYLKDSHCSVHMQQGCAESQCQFGKEQEGEVGGTTHRGNRRGDVKGSKNGLAWRYTHQYQLHVYSSLSFVSSAPLHGVFCLAVVPWQHPREQGGWEGYKIHWILLCSWVSERAAVYRSLFCTDLWREFKGLCCFLNSICDWLCKSKNY